MKLRRIHLIALLLAGALAASAAPAAGTWDDDEDDIYYNASKDKSTHKAQAPADYYVPSAVVDYPDPAGYTPQTAGLNMDVDAYNRHGQFLVGDSIPADSLDAFLDSYAYTKRIERFSNPDIVSGSGNQALIDSYYSQPAAQSDINVYVVNASPWGAWPYYSSWYSPYYNWYGPSWSWSWNMGWYDPWYSWSWGWEPGYYPGYYPGWGPAWGPGWGPAPIYPGRPGHWANSTGASRPHSPAGGSSTVGRRPGAISAGASGYTRPGNMGQNRYNGTYSPAYPSSRPASTGNSGNGTINMNRGRNNSSNVGTRNNSSSSRSSWGNSSPSRNTGSGSYRSGGGGGSRSTHGTGGGSRSTGGGGGRGRR